MNQVTCQVESCCHNESCMCALNKIKVEGPGAARMDQTCCSSFGAKSMSGSNSSCKNACACPDTGIDCKAENCKHNTRCKCTAPVVKVSGCCSSPCVMSETECCTFAAR